MNPLHPNFFKTPKLKQKLPILDSKSHKSQKLAKSQFSNNHSNTPPLDGFSFRLGEKIIDEKGLRDSKLAQKLKFSQKPGEKAKIPEIKLGQNKTQWPLKEMPFKRHRRVPKYPSVDAGDPPKFEDSSEGHYLGSVSKYFRRLNLLQKKRMEETYNECPQSLRDGVTEISTANSKRFLEGVDEVISRLRSADSDQKPARFGEKAMSIEETAHTKSESLESLTEKTAIRSEKAEHFERSEIKAITLAVVNLAIDGFRAPPAKEGGFRLNARLLERQGEALFALQERSARLLKKAALIEARRRWPKLAEGAEKAASPSKTKAAKKAETPVLKRLIRGLKPPPSDVGGGG